MSFADMKMEKVELEKGETIACRERVTGGKKLVLIHGNMVSSRHFDILVDALPEDLHILAPDMRGFGESSYNKEINSLAELADDIKEVLDKKNYSSYSILGWSTGGGVAMEIAADRPQEVEKLILLESVSTRGYPMYEKDKNGQPIPGKLLKTKEEIAADPVKTQPIKNAQEQGNKEFIRQVWNKLIYNNNKPSAEKYEEYLDDILTQRNLVDIYYSLAHFNISSEHNGLEPGNNKAKKIETPTLVLWGENDMVITEDMAQQTAEDLGNNAELVYLENCGHSPLIDDIDQLVEVIMGFMQEK